MSQSSSSHLRRRIVFFGSGAFGLPTLERLCSSDHYHVLGIVTQPDRPAGRGGKLTPTPIAQWIATNHPEIEIIKPPKVNDPVIVEKIRAWPSDIWVIIAFGQKLSARLLEDRFAINLHASLLPRWRGAAPINAAILAGDPHTGNSVITLADRMDAGLILAQTHPPIPITDHITAGELHDLLASQGPDLIETVIQQHAQHTLSPRHQDESLVTIANKLSRNDDNFDPKHSADFIRRQVHALTPWPGISVSLVSDTPQQRIDLKLARVEALPHRQSNADVVSNPGTFTDFQRGQIACGYGSCLHILEVQPLGGKKMLWPDFVRGSGRKLSGKISAVSTRELNT